MSREFRRRQRKLANREARKKEEAMLYSSYYDVDHICLVLSKHPWECVFELDAPKKIVDRLSIRTQGEWIDHIIKNGNQEFKNCFIQSELYCPHEGVNRLKETDTSLDWH